VLKRIKEKIDEIRNFTRSAVDTLDLVMKKLIKMEADIAAIKAEFEIPAESNSEEPK
jgi:hypothetical protein